MTSSAEKISASDALHSRARAFVAAFEAGQKMPESFDALACDIARFQAVNTEGFARLVKARQLDPKSWTHAAEIPAVPTDVFKHARVSTFPASETPITFRTSGTTIGARGSHPFRTTATYDAGAVAFGRWGLIKSYDEMSKVVVMGPSPTELPDSSLTHMIDLFAHTFAEKFDPATTYFMEDGVIDLARLDEVVARALVTNDKPFLMLGTSFAMVHFLDAVGDATFRLPTGSRVMQTGGFKGKSREVDGPTLRREIARAFCIDEKDVVSEYGMTELSSQFYQPTAHGAPAGIYGEPPWARVVPVDGETLEPVADGEVGIARIVDLLNVDSAVVVLTADRVRRKEGGFELLGRAPGAPPRGCSIAIEEMISGDVGLN
ncbi:MAG: acyl-protein synthetase [Polyangiaceae bacterium]